LLVCESRNELSRYPLALWSSTPSKPAAFALLTWVRARARQECEHKRREVLSRSAFAMNPGDLTRQTQTGPMQTKRPHDDQGEQKPEGCDARTHAAAARKFSTRPGISAVSSARGTSYGCLVPSAACMPSEPNLAPLITMAEGAIGCLPPVKEL
jgi:hypothetical protein